MDDVWADFIQALLQQGTGESVDTEARFTP